MPKKTKHAAGEEWMAMNGRGRLYDPAGDADVLRQARANIRERRMGNVELVLRDRAGKPLPGLAVEVEQTRLDFPFGEQLWHLQNLHQWDRWDTAHAREWRRRFAEVFTAANNLTYWTERPEHNAPTTEDRQGEWTMDDFAATVDWTLASGMVAKGHPLFWSIPKCIPGWVKRYDTATLMKFAEVRVRNIVARFKGRVAIWDAVNEPMWEAAPKNLASREWPHIEPIANLVEYIAPVLRWCREEDPDATFLVNDYGMEKEDRPLTGNDGSRVTAASQRKRFVALIRALQDLQAAPDAIGLQSHTGDWQSHRHQWEVYDEFAATGLPVHVTEFWAETRKLKAEGKLPEAEIDALQAEYIANYVTCAFGHPAIEGFFCWGFMTDAVDWKKELAAHELKPAYLRLRKLLREDWCTRVKAVTDEQGRIRFRGFFGDYRLRRLLGDTLRSTAFALAPSSADRFALTV